MRKMKKILLILLFLPAIIFAQTYELDDLIELGLQNSYEMQTESLNIIDSEANLRSSLYTVLPNVSTSLGKTQNNGTWGDINSGLSISESLYLDEPRFFSIRNAFLTKDNDKLTYEDFKKNIAYNIFKKYINVLQAQKRIEIKQENHKLQQKIREQLQIKFDSGEKSLLELKQSEINLLRSSIDLKETTTSLKQSRTDLFAAVNVEDDGYMLAEPDFETDRNFDSLGKNNEQKRYENFLTSSKLNKVQSLLNLFPTFSLTGSRNYSKTDEVLDFPNYESTWSLALGASFNVFGTLDNYENYVKKKHDLRRTEFSIQKYDRDLQISTTKLLENIEAKEVTLKMQKEMMKLAEENLQMAHERFNLGMISLTELDQIQLDFLNSQESYNDIYYSLIDLREQLNLLHSNKILDRW